MTVNTIERDTEQETSFCLLPDVEHVLVRSMVQWTALTIVMTISYTNCLSVYKVLNLIKIFNWFWAQNKLCERLDRARGKHLNLTMKWAHELTVWQSYKCKHKTPVALIILSKYTFQTEIYAVNNFQQC